MRIFAFVCKVRKKHVMNMKDYMPKVYSVWRCSICGITEDREINWETREMTTKWSYK